MNPLDPLSSTPSLVADLASASGKSVAGNAASGASSSAVPSISDLGRSLSQVASRTSSNASSRYRDIDDSDLPDAVKHLLRMIRDLRERLAELARELQAVQADERLDPEVKHARLLQIQAQMSALNGALVSATRKLAGLMRDMQLDQAQQMSAAQLAL